MRKSGRKSGECKKRKCQVKFALFSSKCGRASRASPAWSAPASLRSSQFLCVSSIRMLSAAADQYNPGLRPREQHPRRPVCFYYWNGTQSRDVAKFVAVGFIISGMSDSSPRILGACGRLHQSPELPEDQKLLSSLFWLCLFEAQHPIWG